LNPSSELSLDFLIIGSDTGFADEQPGGPAATKPLVAMTAHASRPLVPQIVTTPSAGQLRPADFRSARMSAASLGTEREDQGTHRQWAVPGTTAPQETCTIADESVILDTT
jgi:hypothetical protein